MTQYTFHINIISNRRQLEAVGFINSAPGLAFLTVLTVLMKLNLLYHWYFLLALAGQLGSIIMVFNPFYSNALVLVSEEGLTLKRRTSLVRSINWSEIQSITFQDLGGPLVYGDHLGTIIRRHDEEVRFGVYRYLFKSKRTITREFIRALLKFPDGRNKLPQELVEKYAET